MQMPALLVAILLAGGNPVWDQQKPQMVCTDRAVVADAVPSGAKAPKLSVMPACRKAGEPVAEIAAPAPVQSR